MAHTIHPTEFPDVLLVGTENGHPAVCWSEPRMAAAWLAISPGDRQVFRVEAIGAVEFVLAEPGEPALAEVRPRF